MELERSARDLQVRGALPAPPPAFPCDLARPETFGPALDAAAESLGRLEAVVVTAADFAPQTELEADPERARSLAALDFANNVGFCEHARQRLLATGGGTLCVFSSVAGDRARSPSSSTAPPRRGCPPTWKGSTTATTGRACGRSASGRASCAPA